ncbi:MAG TPA: hypothetical protein VGG27_15685 [Magnetospirillaceae bacterium]|jgi:1,2-diacylglycerol 3-beta-galactosyltransferase
MKKLTILYTDCGYGHVATANALKRELEEAGTYRVDIIDVYRDVLESIDPFLHTVGISGPDIYNKLVLQRGHTRLLYPVVAAITAISMAVTSRNLSKRLAGYCAKYDPDLILSVMPMINGAAARSVKRMAKRTPFATLVTDFAEFARGVWIHDRSNQYIICGTDRCAEQARAFGIPDAKIFKLDGVIISPDFHKQNAQTQTGEDGARPRHPELSQDLLTGLMMFGGRGSDRMLDYATAIERSALPVQMIYACGTNSALADKIRSLPSERPRLVLGLTDKMYEYMGCSDFFVGKPGPASIAEARYSQLPMILEFGKNTLLQERYNALWARDQEIALLFKGLGDLVATIAKLIEPGTHRMIKSRLHGSSNTAIAELPSVLEQITAAHAQGAPISATAPLSA